MNTMMMLMMDYYSVMQINRVTGTKEYVFQVRKRCNDDGCNEGAVW